MKPDKWVEKLERLHIPQIQNIWKIFGGVAAGLTVGERGLGPEGAVRRREVNIGGQDSKSP
jgi:hypothetical protein